MELFFSSALRKLCLTLVAGGALHAHGALIELDYLNPGDKLLTQDTITGRKWLDATYTMGWSVNRAQSELPNFTLATTQSVIDLFVNSGLGENVRNVMTLGYIGDCGGNCVRTPIEPLAQLITAMKSDYASHPVVQGFTSDSRGQYGIGSAYASLDISQGVFTNPGVGGTLSTEIRPDQTSDRVSVWMFIDGDPQNDGNSPSGVPGPLPLLGGVAAFFWSRRIRNKLRQT